MFIYSGGKCGRLDYWLLFVEEARAPPPKGRTLGRSKGPRPDSKRAAEIEPRMAAGNG